MNQKTYIYDTTLRDGEQGEGIAFTVEDKLLITKLLDNLGVDYIEGGQPGSNPKAIEFFKKATALKLKHTKLVAFGSTCRFGKPAKSDINLQALVSANTPVVTIFGKTWDFHVKDALNISLNDNLKIVADSIQFLKSAGKEVFFDAEHFFDGYKNNPEYSLSVLKTAEAAGADVLVLCDTNGGALPFEVSEIIEKIKPQLKTPLAIHAHNDSGCAVANSISAINSGAIQVQGTINGYGERCGNANLCSIIPTLQLKMGHKALPAKKLELLTSTAHHISEIANLIPDNQAPYVGYSAFAHKGGIHVNAIKKNAATYEHIKPELVGNKQRILISELAGTSNLLHKAQSMGIDLKKDDPAVKELLKKIKELEHAGYQFEEGEASIDLLIKKALGRHRPLFELINYRVTNEHVNNKDVVEATVKIKIGDKIIHTVADGNGPVAALDQALRKALAGSFPKIKEISLADYRVRVLDSKDGTDAKVRVIIISRDDKDIWGTVGVSPDIIEASWQALVDSIEYKLLQ